MSIYKWQLGFFLGLIALGLVLSYQTLKPFLTVLFIAIILVVIFYPLYLKFLSILNGKKWVSSFLATLIAIIVVLLPVAFLGFLLFKESTSLYVEIRSGAGPVGIVETVVNNLNSYLPHNFDLNSYVDVSRYTRGVISWMADNSSVFIAGIFTGALNLLILVLSMFYLFKDGDKLVKKLVEISPLKDVYDHTILDKIHLAVNSVIKGHIIIAIIQGILAGIGFWIFGISSPVIWGFIAAIASFIPSLGTGLVILPAVLFLFFIGSVGPGIGLIIWGAVVVGLVDNIIGPKLIERGVKIHPFLILIFVLGGIQVFGPIGFIAGPVLLSLLFSLLEIYPLMIESHND